jgi:1-acyl-sn-glycerol-3-phosphate acyltransferase
VVERYFTEPYRFIPPYRGTFWCRVGSPLVTRKLRRGLGVTRWHFEGLDALSDSFARGAGVLLASNHCRWTDPLVLGMLGLHVGRYFHYLVSYHLFRQSRLKAWYVRRLGGLSVWREGSDRAALRACAGIVAEGARPLVLFPEGTWFRQNDRLGPLQEGVALIARQAARQGSRPVAVHPVAIKYWCLEDPRPALPRRLDALEARLGSPRLGHLDLLPRLEKFTEAFLAVKEVDHFGAAQPGTLDERIRRLVGSHVATLEKFHLGRVYDGHPLERIRRLRQRLARLLIEKADDAAEVSLTRQALDSLFLCENLGSHSWEYLQEHLCAERLEEAVQRLEETVTDEVESPVVPMGAVVAVGPALDPRQVAPGRAARRAGAGDPLVSRLAGGLQGLLDNLCAQGPPPEWGSPSSPYRVGGTGAPPARSRSTQLAEPPL